MYSHDFESATTEVGTAGSNFGITGATLTGSGSIKTGDVTFGKYYRNMADNATEKSIRANYLTLKTTAFSDIKTAGTNAMTISFWLNTYYANTTNLNDWTASIFVAYNETGNNNHGTTCAFDTRSCFAVHSNCNNAEYYYDKHNGGPEDNYDTKWLPNGSSFAKSWHHVALVYTQNATDASNKHLLIDIYIDGNHKHQYDFTNGATDKSKTELDYLDMLTEFVIGGNSPIWEDKDNAYAYDEIAIYNQALTAEQIATISKKFNYTVKAVDGSNNELKVLASGQDSPNASVSYAYPHYIDVDGTLYMKAAGTGSYYYQNSFTLSSDNQVEEVTYTASSYTGVLYFKEAEDVISSTSTSGAGTRCSNMAGGYASSATKITTLPAGNYTIYFGAYAGNSTHLYFYKNSESGGTIKDYTGSGSWEETNTGEFTLDEATDILVKGGSSGGYVFDYFIVTGTPTNELLGALDYSTDYLVEMSDIVTLAPGQSWHYKFVNHNMGSSAGMAQNWVLPVYASDGTTKKIVIRSDNWEDVKWANTGFGWTTSSGNWYDDFVTEMDNATVDLTINYSSTNVLTMSATITTSTDRTLTYTYNSSTAGVSLSDNIKMAVSVSHSWLELIESWPTTVSGTITPAGWSTFASPYALDLSTLTATNGATAYYAKVADESTVTLTPTGAVSVPAGEGIMVKGTAGETFTINVAASGTAISGNLFKGQTATGNVAASTEGKYHYVFGYETQNPSIYGFYNLDSDTSIPAGKAYLETTTASDSRISIVFADEEATGIADVRGKAEVAREGIFNLSGQRVSQPTKGLYIKNGKKVIMK